MQLSKLAQEFRKAGCEVQEGALMAEFTSFHIGGPADLLVTAYDVTALQSVRTLCKMEEVPLMYLGNGTNMLVGDRGIRGVVLRLDGRNDKPKLIDGAVVCQTNISMKELCRFARDSGLSGLEFAYGIPGSVGGAVYMNAGAYCGQMADVLWWVEALFPDGEIRRFDLEELKLGYRHSVFMENGGLVTKAAFRLEQDLIDSIDSRMEDYMRRRREKQPLEYPSAGSFFKRPEGYFAGALIESSGLKGCRVGGAQISEKHAGFIINRGGASCRDVLSLSDKVRKCVLRDHGVQLQPEVCCIGEQ